VKWACLLLPFVAESGWAAGQIEPNEIVRALKAGGEKQANALSSLEMRLFRSREEHPTQRQQELRKLDPVWEFLSSVPTKDEDDQLVQRVCKLLISNRVASPHSVTFARGLISRKKSDELTSPVKDALALMAVTQARDDAFRDLLLPRLEALEPPVLRDAMQYLRSQYPEDPGVAKAIGDLLSTADEGRLKVVIGALRGVSLEPASAAKVAKFCIGELTSGEQEPNAKAWLRFLTSQPGTYGGTLARDEWTKLLARDGGAPAETRTNLLAVLATAARLDGGLAPRLLDAFGNVSGRESRVLAVFGFLDPRNLSQESRTNLNGLLRNGKGLGADAFAGICSILIRSTERPERVIAELGQRFKGDWMYWRSLRNPVIEQVVPPENWIDSLGASEKASGQGTIRVNDVRYLIISMSMAPEAPQVRVLVEEVLKRRGDFQFLLETLWEMRASAPSLKASVALREWLNEKASQDGDFDICCLAAGLLGSVWDEKAKALDLVGAALAKSPKKAFVWSSAVEVLIELGPDSPQLKLVRQRLKSRGPRGEHIPGGRFLEWLLDIRLAGGAAEVPFSSLCEVLGSPGAVACCGGLARAGTRIGREQLDTLRTPALLFAARESRALEAYLGAIDHIDLRIRQASRGSKAPRRQ